MPLTNFSLDYWCVLIAALLPIVCAGLAKSRGFGKPRAQGGYDNGNPREWLQRQSEGSARANAAQANSFEALPFFIGAVLIAHQLGADQALLDMLAVAYIALRVAYIAAYLANQASLRSLLWLAALGVNVAILFAGYR
jgi:uncharacterized MAPEG superfamily protein